MEPMPQWHSRLSQSQPIQSHMNQTFQPSSSLTRIMSAHKTPKYKVKLMRYKMQISKYGREIDEWSKS
eukprot:11666704-Ditylum_brightwellii.AAC.1